MFYKTLKMYPVLPAKCGRNSKFEWSSKKGKCRFCQFSCAVYEFFVIQNSWNKMTKKFHKRALTHLKCTSAFCGVKRHFEVQTSSKAIQHRCCWFSRAIVHDFIRSGILKTKWPKKNSWTFVKTLAIYLVHPPIKMKEFSSSNELQSR